MEAKEKAAITVRTTINAPISKVWDYWTKPSHVTKWNHALDSWHLPRAENDLRPGGRFSYRMEARDGSMGFDFGGVYDVVMPMTYIESTLGDGRKIKVNFSAKNNSTHVDETFEAETQNPIDMQRAGWQAILDNFKKYVEAN